MVEDPHITKWLGEGLITKQQAQRMLADVKLHRTERSSDKLIVVISTVGAILLGIGAVLFVASNWQALSNLAKTLLLTVSTFGVSVLGYLLAYERRTFPKVGGALLFLGCLLFGATLFLIGQMYNIQAHSHVLILVWLIGILPLVYVLQSVPIAGLASLLLFLWIGFFVFRGTHLAQGDWAALPVLYLVSGLAFFEAGGLHYLSDRLRTVARTYRIAALKAATAALFLLTFRFFSGHLNYGWDLRAGVAASPQMTNGVTLVLVAAILLGGINVLCNPSKSSTWKIEGVASLGLMALASCFFFYPSSTNIYTVLFNLAMAGCIGLLITLGYQREDIRLMNIGMCSLILLLLVRYCDFFWELLSRSVFFLVGGALLLLGGIALERKRRQLKARFSQ